MIASVSWIGFAGFWADLAAFTAVRALVPAVLCSAFLSLTATSAERHVENFIPDWPRPIQAPQGAPNILMILLDDVGFGDASTFGGPAQTPQLDQLAAQGLSYNRFHVTPTCSPTRAALLSGRNAHKAGFGTVVNFASGFPGHNGIWRKDTVTVADVLRRNGYSTAAFGKWHNTPQWEVSPVGPFDRWPTALGFEFFYGFMSGEDSQWEPTLYRNTTAVEARTTPQQGYHLTSDLVDDAIRWVHTHESLAPDKPYFLYFATGAAHAPHHVPKGWIDRYRGHFDQGWDRLRGETFARQKQRGVIPANAELTPRPEGLPAWQSLSIDQRRLLSRQMEIYAAFLAHTDHEVGRLIRTVQEGPQADNTLIFYIVGDNGAGGMGDEGSEDYYADILKLRAAPAVKDRLAHLDALGSERFRNSYARAWGWASNTPFQSMKGDGAHFGGLRAPLVISWPARIKDHGTLRSQFTNVTDIAATLYEVTGVRFPSTVDGVNQQALDGLSLAYTFDHPSAPSQRRRQVFEHNGNRAIYQDGWMAAAPHCLSWKCPVNGTDTKDFSRDPWELYHVEQDFSQANDVAARYPEKLKALQALFETEARANRIYPMGSATMADQPWPAKGRRTFDFYPGLPRTPSDFVVPTFTQAHRITAQLVIPEQGAQGVILTAGSRYEGFALYIKDDRLVYENHAYGARRDFIASQDKLPRGDVVLAYEFRPDVAATPQVDRWGVSAVNGRGYLFINGQQVGEGTQGPITSRVYAGMGATLGVGRAFGSPVSEAYSLPFEFTGALKKVTVQVQ